WELVRSEGTLVPVNTSNPNRIVAEALAEGLIPELEGYSEVRREVRYGEGSRIDFLLTDPDRADSTSRSRTFISAVKAAPNFPIASPQGVRAICASSRACERLARGPSYSFWFSGRIAQASPRRPIWIRSMPRNCYGRPRPGSSFFAMTAPYRWNRCVCGIR